MTAYEVLGTEVQMPVRIRHASCFVAGYTASAPAAQAMIADTGLRVMQVRPGRTMCMLVFVDYVDGDLGPYNEFGVCLLLEDPDTPGKATISEISGRSRPGRPVPWCIDYRSMVTSRLPPGAGSGVFRKRWRTSTSTIRPPRSVAWSVKRAN